MLARHTRKLFKVVGATSCGLILITQCRCNCDSANDKKINFFGIKINNNEITVPSFTINDEGFTINDKGITMPGLKINDKGIEGNGIKINDEEVSIKGMRISADSIEVENEDYSDKGMFSFGNLLKIPLPTSVKYVMTKNGKKYEFTIIRKILHINNKSTNIKIHGNLSVSIKNNEIIVNNNYIDLDDY